MLRGRVQDVSGAPISVDARYVRGATVHYFREVAAETALPVGERVLYRDDHLVVADKPHFLPVQPAGRFVHETLLARLRKSLDNDALVPLHRLDRATAGLVLLSACAESRGSYARLFAEQRIEKTYDAIAPALPHMAFPLRRESRLVRGEPFFRMAEAPGSSNAITDIDVIAREGADLPAGCWHYRLRPRTGRKHQLRVHMAGLGAPILGDPWYPVLLSSAADQEDETQAPLRLLAKSLRFDDPLTGQAREFVSARSVT